MGCNKCEVCCRNCCYSTPLLTLVMVIFTGVSLLGFALSGIYAFTAMRPLPHIGNGTVVMGPVVCGMVVITILPIILVSFMSYCVTGYIRDIFFHNNIKTCIGSSNFNVMFLIGLLVYILLWVLLMVGLGGVMAFYLQLEMFCAQEMATTMATCLYYVDTDFGFLAICDSNELEVLCEDGLSVGLSFSLSLLFAILVTLGLITLTVIHAYNFVSARDHIDYRENTRNEYDMKRVR